MARTDAGAALTVTHRAAQLQIRTRALRDFTLMWPMWTGDEDSFQRLLTASMVLVRAYHGASAAVAADYYRQFRAEEQIAGPPTPCLADRLDEDVVRGTLYLTGLRMTGRALAAGQAPEQAMATALTRTSGTMTRFVLAGGRDTLLLTSAEDRQARGWARVTGGKPCAFCAMLASRGAAYLNEGTADFEAHDHCSCTAEIQYEDAALPPDAERWRGLYNQAQREARASGDGADGTANDALNNFRRLLSRQ